VTESTLTTPFIPSNNERRDTTMFFTVYDGAMKYTFDFVEAFALAQNLIDRIITQLRRDPRWADLRRHELDLLFADIREQFAQDIFAQFDGFVPFSELRRAAGEALAEVLQAKKPIAKNVRRKTGGNI
jgi:hypothetical protein